MTNTAPEAERDFYQETARRLEPDLATVDQKMVLTSIAVSLKRIADALSRSDGRKLGPPTPTNLDGF